MRLGEQEQLRRTAYHEARHAVMAQLVRIPYTRVSVVPVEPDGSLGRCSLQWWPPSFDPETDDSLKSRVRLENLVMVCLAGHIGEAKLTGRNNFNRVQSRSGSCAELLELPYGRHPGAISLRRLAVAKGQGHVRTARVLGNG